MSNTEASAVTDGMKTGTSEKVAESEPLPGERRYKVTFTKVCTHYVNATSFEAVQDIIMNEHVVDRFIGIQEVIQ